MPIADPREPSRLFKLEYRIGVANAKLSDQTLQLLQPNPDEIKTFYSAHRETDGWTSRNHQSMYDTTASPIVYVDNYQD